MGSRALPFIYLSLIVFAFLIGVVRFNKLDSATKILVSLFGLTAFSEGLAFFFARHHENNMPIYHFYSPIELLMVSLYFNFSIDTFKRNKIGWVIGLIGIIVAIANAKFLQPLYEYNSNFLLFEGFCILSMSLFAFYRILENEEVIIFQTPHFWICCILLFFWGITYANWSLYTVLIAKKLDVIPYIGLILLYINIMTYLGFSIVLVLLPKRKL